MIIALIVLAFLATIVTSRQAPLQGVTPTPPPNNPYAAQPFCVGGVLGVDWFAGWNLIDGGAALIATNFPGAMVYGWDGSAFHAVDPRNAIPDVGY